MFAAQSSLFDQSGPAGLRLGQAIVTPDEEQALLTQIAGVRLSPFHYQGWQGKRLTASFGWRYDSIQGSLHPLIRSPNGCCPCAIGPRNSLGLRRPRSFRRC